MIIIYNIYIIWWLYDLIIHFSMYLYSSIKTVGATVLGGGTLTKQTCAAQESLESSCKFEYGYIDSSCNSYKI